MTDGASPREAGGPRETAGDSGYQVIARRYRPRFFHEVVGQEATAEALRQAHLQNRLAHAYLFCGPRGVGKTSMARIFARTLQCPNTKEGDPCDQCGTCDRIFRGEDMDVTEMDGASHRGIDDVRDLIQHVRYAPSEGPYRIFIIDEVHMLTREAFNALLKTLEEPPAHVKFIFATTEPEKILSTVLSRCQRFDFSPISNADIVRRLQQISEAEGVEAEAGLLERVADLARGGMRDSQSLLDQLLSFTGCQPTQEALDHITGRLAPQRVRELVDFLGAGDRAQIVVQLQEIAAKGTDPAVLLEQVVDELRDRLHQGVQDGWGDAEIERNLLAQEILQEARLRTRQLGRADLVLELALLRISTLADLVSLAEAQELGDNEPGAGPAAATRSQGAPARGQQASARTQEASGRTQEASGRTQAPPGQPRPQRPTAPQGGTTPRSAESRSRERRSAPSPREPGSQDSPGGDPTASFAASEVAIDTSRAAPTTAVGGDPERSKVSQALESAAPMVARLVGESFRFDAQKHEVVLELDAASAEFVDGRRLDECRRSLAEAFGRTVTLKVRVVAADAEALDEEVSGPPGAPGAPAAVETPEIVEKAKEIFRGSVRRTQRGLPEQN